MNAEKFIAAPLRKFSEQEKHKARLNLASMALRFGWSREELKVYLDALGL